MTVVLGLTSTACSFVQADAVGGGPIAGAGSAEAVPSGALEVAPALRGFWEQHSEELGAPAAAAVTRAGVVSQEFAGGTGYADPDGHVGYVTGGIRAAYQALGDAPEVGVPLDLQTCGEGARECVQHLSGGLLVWSKRDGARVVPADRTVRLAGAPNFRDVAGEGAGLAVADGANLRRGVVYRADALAELTGADILALTALGVTAVYDLRTPRVADQYPDPVIPGAENRLMNLFGRATSPFHPVTTLAEVAQRGRDTNRLFVTDRVMRRQLRELLEAVANSEGAVLIHCTEGKDRTGWASAMLQYIAGAGDDEVLAEYLKSNAYRKKTIATHAAEVRRNRGAAAAAVYTSARRVDASYLNAGLAEARARYGSITGYLTRGVGLSDETLASLRAKLRS
nr:tyrosine-protein phosphatase [Propionicimonas sp.]